MQQTASGQWQCNCCPLLQKKNCPIRLYYWAGFKCFADGNWLLCETGIAFTHAQASKGGLLMESMQWLSCPPRLKNKFASLQACLKLRPTNRVNSVDLQVKLKSYKFYHWADFNIGVNSLRYSWKVNKFNWLNQGFLLTPKFSRYVMQSMLGNRKLIQIAQTTSHGQWQRKKNCSVATVAHFDQIWASLKKTPVTVV